MRVAQHRTAYWAYGRGLGRQGGVHLTRVHNPLEPYADEGGHSLFFLTCRLIVKSRWCHIKIYYRKVMRDFWEAIFLLFRLLRRFGFLLPAFFLRLFPRFLPGASVGFWLSGQREVDYVMASFVLRGSQSVVGGPRRRPNTSSPRTTADELRTSKDRRTGA